VNFPGTYIYCKNLCVNQPLKVTFSGVAVALSRVTALNLMQFSLEFAIKLFYLNLQLLQDN